MTATHPADRPRILLADDRDFSRDLIATELEERGCEVVQVVDGLQAWEKFRLYHFDLVISDLRMPNGDGMSLLRRIVSRQSPNPQVPVLLVSAFGDLSTAAEAGRAGAVDFLAFNESGIEGLAERAIDALRDGGAPLPLPLIGESSVARRLRQQIEAYASLAAPIVILGEAGSGREAIARHLHCLSTGARLAFVSIPVDQAASMLLRLRQGTAYLGGFDRFGRDEQLRWLERIHEAELLAASAPVRFLLSMEEPPAALVADGALNEEAGRSSGASGSRWRRSVGGAKTCR